jgi:hypothetical protein
MNLVRQTFRTDTGTADALRRRADVERTTVPDLLREAIRLRLEAGAVIDLVRVAVADVVAQAQSRIDAMGQEWRERVVEVEERERAITRSDITDFIEGLAQFEEASRGAPKQISIPATIHAHDQLSK